MENAATRMVRGQDPIRYHLRRQVRQSMMRKTGHAHKISDTPLASSDWTEKQIINKAPRQRCDQERPRTSTIFRELPSPPGLAARKTKLSKGPTAPGLADWNTNADRS